jgi:signal transduction histidine kinase
MQTVHRRYAGYLFAVLACCVATLARFAVAPIVGDRAHFFTYMLALLAVARYCGFGPALLTSVLGGLMGMFFFMPPTFSFYVADYGGMLVLCLYFIVAVTASWLCGSLHAAEQRARSKQQELESAEQTLRGADRRKDEFLATLAHELRNPLAPLQNAVHVLHAAGSAEPDVQWCEGIIERQVRQLARLLDDLLDASRITFGKLELRKSQIELARVIEDAVEISRPAIDDHGHELIVTLPSEAIVLQADAVRITQVLSNLLNNAAKFTDDGGQIRLLVERQGSDVAICVQDNGIGIDAQTLPQIFEMFSQASPALTRTHGGLGIGLALVKGIVELHGGTIEVHSAGRRRGSEFRLRLPMEVAALYQPLKPVVLEPTAVKRSILVADDNHDAADSLARMLKIMGHEVHVAYDGEQAVNMALSLRPEVVLLDIGMPKLNGYEAARRIRRDSSSERMLLIALTGWGQEQDVRLAQEAGFDHHLLKPLEATALAGILSDLEIKAG